MKSIIIGTAGHIDHGKTALVKALTGIDADRLEEEKRRGITIDLGFAHLELAMPGGLEPTAKSLERQGGEADHAPSRVFQEQDQLTRRRIASGAERSDKNETKLRLGFIDVPGHERFVRNMLAGVGGIDLVLMVIAADESIKPQTREHFEICRLLSIPRGITVITKSDIVDEDTLSVVRMEIEDFVRGSFLDASRSPVVAVSALKGTGLDELKREIIRLAADVPARDIEALFRLPIDRVFTMKGFGAVVTGTLIAGKVKKEEEVEVFPARKRARVRGVQVHGSMADQAIAGQRTALNLAGVQMEELARGMTLAAPGAFEPTQRFEVQISLLKDAKPLKNRARVHFHAFTSETIAEVALRGVTELKPGASAFAQLRTAEPLLLLPGDRAILRQFSPVVTIGGAVVLDAFPLARQKQDAVQRFLQALSSGNRQEALLARIARRGHEGLSVAAAVRETGLKQSVLQPTIAALVQEKQIIQVAEYLLANDAMQKARDKFIATLEAFHKANPLVAGISKEELREKLGLHQTVMEAMLTQLTRDKKAEVSGEQVRLAGRGVELKDEEAKAKEQIERAFADAGLKVPLMKEVLDKLPVDKARAQKLVTLLLRDRVLIKLADDLVFHQTALQGLRHLMATQKAKTPKIDVATFKDMLGVTRKYAIPLLEYLDQQRITRRVGDERIIL
ncbi:MAG TPA: selenocysteine-specific translation elongation factor [Candidatus Dormibacteraeota bacterium]|jgi:selenocysteine-specific elongation factor|nr:selenocysteine-specific translation elongation factor [Candidatus Dormibacteraeota bacterium]